MNAEPTSPFPQRSQEAHAQVKLRGIIPKVLFSAAIGLPMNKLAIHPEQSPRTADVVNRVGGLAVRHSSMPQKPLTTETRDTVTELYKDGGYWHGTGRHHYQADGSTVDVLKQVLQEGIKPQHDEFDPLAGSMETVSLATARMYSRIYADMHGKGAKEEGRYGTASLWSSYFVGNYVVEGLLETELWAKENRDRWREFLVAPKLNNGMRWWDKVHSSTWGYAAPFEIGSDIPGNYPILMGIKEQSVQPTEASNILGIHEVRTSHYIAPDSLTHLEVPDIEVAGTLEVIDTFGLDIPVLAIEDAESYAAEQDFLKLVRPATA